MRKVIYQIGDVQTTSYTEMKNLEKDFKKVAEIILEDTCIEEPKVLMSPIRQAMLEQFGYVHPRLKELVVVVAP